VLSQVCDDIVEYGYASANPARGRKRRLKAAKPRRTWLELDEVRAILDAAGDEWLWHPSTTLIVIEVAT
jgi:hypothetical protein